MACTESPSLGSSCPISISPTCSPPLVSEMCEEFIARDQHREQMCPGLHTGWSFCLRLDKTWVSFGSTGLTLCTAMTTGRMADGKGEEQMKMALGHEIRHKLQSSPDTFCFGLEN